MTEAKLTWSIWQALLNTFAWAFTRRGHHRFGAKKRGEEKGDIPNCCRILGRLENIISARLCIFPQ